MATGAGTISYQWYYNNSNSTEGGQKIQGVTETSYTIVAENVTTSLNGRYYYCEITQNYGNATATIKTNTALLSVVEPVTITTNPAAVTVTPESNVTFTVAVNGTGTLGYQWYVNTSDSTTGGTAISGATNSSYPINSVSSSNNGKYYYCMVTQTYGGSTVSVTSKTALLTVGNKVSVSNPSDVSVIASKTAASFTVTATGSGTFTYQWYQNTTNSNSGGSAISGATSGTYTIAAENVTTSLNGKYYYCVVTQNYGSSTVTATSNAAKLNVVAEATITKQPAEVSVIAGKTAVTYTVTASGTGLTYQWYQNSTNSNSGGTVISGATGSTYTIAAANATTSLNGKYYYCVITQKYGSSTVTVTSNAAKLNVTETAAITKQPAEVSVIAGKTAVTYSITASGTGLTYQWYQNSTNSNSGGSAISGATSSTYTIAAANVTTSLNGKYYYCVVTQTYGSSTGTVTSNAAKLNVVAATTITKQPAEVSVIASKTAVTYSVTASGTGLTYQWYQNSTNSNSGGSAISGATGSTYTIAATNVTTSLSGKYYYCIVTQKYGSSTTTVTSNAAKLNVVSAVTISSHPSNATAPTNNIAATFSVTASGNGTLSYQWYYKTSSTGTGYEISGATNKTYSIDPLYASTSLDGNYYYCVVTQTYGSSTATVTSNVAQLTIVEIPEQWQATTSTDSAWYSYNGAKILEPKLEGKMTPIKYTGETQTGNKWANAVTKDGSMWVWIPRFAYMITAGYHSNTSSGAIQVAFVNTSNQFLNGETGEITTNPNEEGAGLVKWLVHPAFTSNATNGGGFGELKGLWVGKFEATGTTTSLSVKPGIASLRSMTINAQYKLAKTSTFGETVALRSHMAKNSEWGATVYLGHSKYGTNRAKIEQNTNSSYYTGGSNTKTAIYTTNKTQSTTHNATGVYDLNGGAWEYVASYVNNGGSYLSSNGGTASGDLYGANSSERATATAYKMVYEGTGTQSTDYETAKKYKGDGVYETSNNHSSSTGSWFSALSSFPFSSCPFFALGARYSSANASTFCFNNSTGNIVNYGSFRPVLAP